MRRSTIRTLIWLFCAGTAVATTVRVENTAGSIEVQVAMGSEGVQLRGVSPARPMRPGDVQYSHTPEEVLIRCHPDDMVRIDLVITVPHTVRLEATTSNGAISFSGLLPYAHLTTASGNVKVATSWQLMRLGVRSQTAPRRVLTPKVRDVQFVICRSGREWALRSLRRFDDRWSASSEGGVGDVLVEATAPGRVECIQLPVPPDSWVRAPSEAPGVLEGMLQSVRKRKAPPTTPNAKSTGVPTPSGEGPRDPVFTSDVRLVNLSVPVYDRDGHPLAGLKPDDFEVIEDGSPQTVAFAQSGELPFNLVLFLDLSSSTINTRPLMVRAARDFVEMARPQDRIGIQALANSVFHVVLPLTHDRKRALDVIEMVPAVTGGTPLYDALVLSCAQESLYRMEDRPAIVVLSDGMDNQLQGPKYGSRIPFSRLLNAVAEWPVLIYPIRLPYAPQGVDPTAGIREVTGRERMQKLADASGGRLFEAVSVEDLTPVYAQVVEELRSVYTVGYYPRNQEFNGAWRRIQIRLKRSGLRLRARTGYYAW